MNITSAGAFLKRVFPPAVMALALLLRMGGMDNDLHHGQVYHPDSPKIVHETLNFFEGRFLNTGRGPAYDGYPFFTSYAASALFHCYDAGRIITRRIMGLPFTHLTPAISDIHWLMRWMNAVLSTLAVGLVFAIGIRSRRPRTAVAAALLLALSPIDVVSAKEATGDVMAAFMALATIYFALRALDENRWRDYVFGGLCAAAAFSAKYHGGMALIGFLVAHLVRHPFPRKVFKLESLGKGIVLLASFAGGIMLTSPAFLVDAGLAWDNMRHFLVHISNFGLSEEMARLTPLQRAAAGLRCHLPILFMMLSPVAGAAVLLSFIFGFVKQRDPSATGSAPTPFAPRARFWVVASLPLFYLVPGIAIKPNPHIIYHSLITPELFLMAATTLAMLTEWRRRKTGLAVFSILLLASAAFLARHTLRENFFFAHNDTRLLAEAWAHENIPSSIRLWGDRYTFADRDWPGSAAHLERKAYAFSAYSVPPAVEGAFVMRNISFENFKLTLFRNWPIRFFMRESDLIRADSHMPPPQRQPSEYCLNMIEAGAPEFCRSSMQFDLFEKQVRSSILLASEPLSEVVLIVRTASSPAVMDISVGGRHQRLRVPNYSVRAFPVSSLKPLSGLGGERVFYRLELRGIFGYARVAMATTPRDIAWAWFRAGAHEKAFHAFGAIPEDGRGPAETVMFYISGRLAGLIDAGSMPADPLGIGESKILDDESSFFRVFGISPDYIEALPFIRLARTDLAPEDPMAEHGFVVRTPYLLPLDPGWYRVVVHGDRLPEQIEAEARDEWDRVIETIQLGASRSHFEREGLFRAPANRHCQQFILRGLDPSAELPMEIRIHPAPLPTMNSLLSLLYALRDPGAGFDPDPLHYEALIRCGDLAMEAGHEDEARPMYEAASRGAPERTLALERLSAAPSADKTPGRQIAETKPETAVPAVEANALFFGGARLTAYRLDTSKSRPGGSVGLNLYWRPASLSSAISSIFVWVHFIHVDTGQVIFQGDRPLMARGCYRDPSDPLPSTAWPPEYASRADMVFQRHPDETHPHMNSARIPENAPSGEYAVHVGLWLPHLDRRIKVRESGLPHGAEHIILCRFNIE